MCYSERSSWWAFGVGSAGILANIGFLAFFRRYSLIPFMAAWISVVVMQLFEALMYRETDCDSEQSQRLRSAAATALRIQPIALTMGAAINCLVEGTYPALWAVTVVMTVAAISFGPSGDSLELSPVEAPSTDACIWRPNDGDHPLGYFVGMTAPVLLLPKAWGALYAILLVVTVTAGTVADAETWGSKWCHLANYAPIIMMPASAANW